VHICIFVYGHEPCLPWTLPFLVQVYQSTLLGQFSRSYMVATTTTQLAHDYTISNGFDSSEVDHQTYRLGWFSAVTEFRRPGTSDSGLYGGVFHEHRNPSRRALYPSVVYCFLSHIHPVVVGGIHEAIRTRRRDLTQFRARHTLGNLISIILFRAKA
jgi:hypothetical protein